MATRPSSTSKTTVVTARLPKELSKKLDDAAAATKQTKTEVIIASLTRFLGNGERADASIFG